MSVNPKSTKMPPDMFAHTSGGTIIKAVDTLSRNVNAITESPKDPTTTYGVHRLFPAALVPMTTGSTGKMHGASTVRSPATNEIRSSVIT
jgi:hypothetical protein